MVKKTKRVLSLLLIGLLLVSACGCVSKAAAEVDSLISEVGALTPSQAVYDNIVDKYNALTAKQREQVTKSAFISRYDGIDLDKVISLTQDISNIDDDTKFSTILKIMNELETLSDKEYSFVNKAKLENAMKINDIEKAAISAAQNVIKSLKNPNSFKLSSIDGIDDTSGTTGYFLINLTYSATNSFGGEISDTSFQIINKEFEQPLWGLAILSGDYESALNCTSYMSFYLLHDDLPTELDCDKIQYFAQKE